MSFKRSYAFESDVSADVKDMLEKVEDVVDEKCETPEDCDKLVEKIEKKEDQFNDALKGMADAAKDCKDGKCDKSELKEKLDPHVSCLKTIAKDIGVASESDLVTDAELQDVKDYIEGAKEIVEAKKDELEGESEEKDDDKNDDSKNATDDADSEDESEDDSEDDDAEECATESFIAEIAASAVLENLGISVIDMDSAMEAIDEMGSDAFAAMEGYNWDRRAQYKAKMKLMKLRVKEAKRDYKAGNTKEGIKKMSAVVDDLKKFKKSFAEEIAKNSGVIDSIFGYFAYGFRGMGLSLLTLLPTLGLGSAVVSFKHTIDAIVTVVQAVKKIAVDKENPTAADFNVYTKSMEHNMDIIISMYEKTLRQMRERAGNDGAASESWIDEFDGIVRENTSAVDTFIDAMESMMITTDRDTDTNTPYLFD